MRRRSPLSLHPTTPHAVAPNATRPTLRRPGRALVLLAAVAMAASACGSSGSDAADADAAVDATAEETTETGNDAAPADGSDADGTTSDDAEDGAAEDGTAAEGAGTDNSGGSTSSTSTCSSSQLPTGGYLVTNIPANDPDGGLVARSGAGSSSSSLFVLPELSGVFPGASSDDCVVLDGSVWWQAFDEGGAYWVNSAYLGKYPATGVATAVGTSQALCDSYDIVMSTRETDAFPVQALMQLDAELDFHPTGVSGAIGDLLNGTTSGDEYDTIAGYVGAICDGDAGGWDAAPLADTAQACLDGTADACDTLQGFNMSPEGALARAFVTAVMDGDEATLIQLSSPELAANFGPGPYDHGDDYGVSSIQLDGSTFAFLPFPTGSTWCTITGSSITSCVFGE
ncbi:MAG: hypothetical protein ACRBI6_12900 [Acidimicrobiales bacterium]